MIDFRKTVENRQRQDSVIVNGNEHKIHTGFCFWVSFAKKIEEWNRTGDAPSYDEFDYLYASPVPEDRVAGYGELIKFYRNEQKLPSNTGKERNIRGVDWLIDSEYIYAAFMQQYGIDLLKSDLHWHSFLALFNGLTNTKMNEIIAARFYDKSDKRKFEEVQEENREMWALEELEEFERPVFEMI